MSHRGDGRGRGAFRGQGDSHRGGRGGGPPRGGGGFRGGGPPRGGAPSGPIIYSPPNASANIDTRLANNSEDTLVQSFQKLSIMPKDLPLRPGFGTAGKVIKLRANFFPVKLPESSFYEYDVDITPAAGTAARRVKRRIFQLAEQTDAWKNAGLKGACAHDHASRLISVKELAQPLTIEIGYLDEDETGKPKKSYTLTFNFTKVMNTATLLRYVQGRPDYRDPDAIQPIISALNIILAAYPNRTGPGGGILVGRNRYFFPSESRAVSLGGGLEAWRGFYSSVRPVHKQLAVNVNVCTTAFYAPGNLADAIMSFENSSFGARASAFVRGVRVKMIHLNHRKSVKTVSNQTARTSSFQCDEFRGKITVQDYFKRKYNISLRHPDLPLVDVGGPTKSTLVPAELCEILPNQSFKGKLTDEATAAMIKVAANPPAFNARAITEQGLDKLGFRNTAEQLQKFGISIGNDMAVVPGRILTPPRINYGKGAPRVDDRASWNLKDVQFKQGGVLSKWVVLNIKDGNRNAEFPGIDDPELKQTISGFMQTCKTSGIQVNLQQQPLYCEARLPQKDGARDPTRASAIAVIRETLRKLPSKPSFVFVILSNGDKHIYNGIKHLCDSYLDIASVCVQVSKFRKQQGQIQYFANVALKINMKMGGVNHVLDASSTQWLLRGSTMLVGADVTHPGPGSVKHTPSIAAVVASIDNSYAQYPASMRIQESKKEMITDLEAMMFERLETYRARNKQQLPERIMYYRDGVSEGQFRIVLDAELPQFKAAIRRFDTPTKKYSSTVKLTIIICGKRHHTRFYPTTEDGADRNGNPKAGTVVDRGVTAVYDFDFFLQAHGGLQGTTRPTHYYVVHDENRFTADELQGLTNSVSYMFSRATKAVSLVSPAYYADLACERGRCYLHKLLTGITNVNPNAKDAEASVWKEAEDLFHNGASGPALKSTMFYL